MVLPGHLSGGYLAARAALALAGAGAAALSPDQMTALLVIGTLFGEGPDIDLFFFYFKRRAAARKEAAGQHEDHVPEGHREFITHMPLFWVLLGGAISLAGWLFGSTFTVYAGLMVWAGSWSHLLLDSIEWGVPWLWPLTTRRFCLRQVQDPVITGHIKGSLGYYRELLRLTLFRNITSYAEVVVTAAALWVAFH